PSQTNPGPFTSGSSTRRIPLAFTRLSDQVPETGLQRRTPACEVQPAPCQLLGLSRIPLRQPHLGQTEEHLRLPWSYALCPLQARRSTVQIATALLLLGTGQQG